MINYIKNDLTTVSGGLIIHGTNCGGAFGAGVARAIRAKWPVVCQTFWKSGTGQEMLGKFIPIKIDEGLIIGNCYTQLNYGADSRKYASVEAITESLGKAVRFAIDNNIDTISLPKIGAGLGGLDWASEVLPIIEELERQNNTIAFNIYYID